MVPIGSFPTKEEVITNPTFLEVYEKYYKYSTVTNDSGDYMIFGVPIGVQTVHMSCDITDIGRFSMTPGTMINQLGYSPFLFSDDGTKVKYSTDLDVLPNVELQEISVEIIPFWGDDENFDIGITRQDFKLRALLTTSITIFGAAFTDAFRATWGQGGIRAFDQDREMWRMNDNTDENISIGTKQNGKIVPTIYYYPARVTDADIISGNVDTTNDILKMDSSEYTSYIQDGQFIFIIPCNRRKIITDENGVDVVVSNDNSSGVFSEFRGMILFEYAPELPLPQFRDIGDSNNFDNHTYSGQRWKMKFPQDQQDGETLNEVQTGVDETYNEIWRKQSYKFTFGNFYSIAKFHHLDFRDDHNQFINQLVVDPYWNTGIIGVGNGFYGANADFQFPSNATSAVNVDLVFGAEWLNFSIHFPVHTFFIRNSDNALHSNTSPTLNPNSYHFYRDNTQNLIGKDTNTRIYLRGDRHKTDFVLVPKDDIINIIDHTLNGTSQKGFRSIDPPYNTPLNALNNASYKGTGSIKYFYKGIGSADCFLFLRNNGLI